MKLKTLQVLLLLLLSTTSFAQPTIEELEARIGTLETEKQQQKDKFELAIQQLELKADSAIKEKLDSTEEQLRNTKTALTVFGLLLGSVTIASLIALVFSGQKYIKKQMEERIDGLIGEKEVEIRGMISDQELDTRLRRDAKFFVLSPSASKQEDIMEIITLFKFKPQNVTYKQVKSKEDLEELSVESDSIVVINDMENSFNRELLKELLSTTSNEVLFLGFVTGDKQLPRHQKMSFANSKFTFYSNLMNMAKFREIRTER